ncbi:MAG: BRCT domain-containing protein [Deltaproteobacteria bacterium]|jgi:NAD-dependent DNA ligase|nr:BRCT domain-containing protein [Deltaproteobacteria bacterium]
MANSESALGWPGNVIADRLKEIYADGIVTKDELAELKDLLKDLSGGLAKDAQQPVNLSTALPLDDPVPSVEFADKTFCFTGTLCSGPRKDAAKLVTGKGGNVIDTITMKLDYLVIGVIASRDWKFTSHGNKILKAIEYKKEKDIKIISEETFLKTIFG